MTKSATKARPSDLITSSFALVAAAYLIYRILWWAYKIRLQAIEQYGAVIHEFDPYFNYRATEVGVLVVKTMTYNNLFRQQPNHISCPLFLNSTFMLMAGESSLLGLITCRGIHWEGQLVQRFILECNLLQFGSSHTFYPDGPLMMFVATYLHGLEVLLVSLLL